MFQYKDISFQRKGELGENIGNVLGSGQAATGTVGTSCIQEVCSDTPVRMCSNGSYYVCSAPNEPVKLCQNGNQQSCVDDWVTTCRLVNTCPPPYIPPYIPPPVNVPSGAPTPADPPPDPKPACCCNGPECYDGVGNCNWSACDGTPENCLDRHREYFMRIISREGPTGTTAWKPGNQSVNIHANDPANFSINRGVTGLTNEQLWANAMDSEGYFTNYKPYSSDIIKTFDKSKNRIDNTMQLLISGVGGYHWSNAFCSGDGKAIKADPSDPRFLGEETRKGTSHCPKGPFICKTASRNCKEDNWRLFCDYFPEDGCWRNGIEDLHEEEVFKRINNNLRKMDELGYSIDNSFDGYWSLSFIIRDKLGGSPKCTNELHTINYVAPEGYRCKDFKPVSDRMRPGYYDGIVYKEFNVGGDNRKCNLQFYPSESAMMFIEIEAVPSCNITASVNCIPNSSIAEIQWNASNFKGGTPDRSVLRLNMAPFTDWFNVDTDRFFSYQDNEFLNKKVNVQIIEGMPFDFRASVDKVNPDGTYSQICSSPTIPFICLPQSPNLCQSSSVINHNFGSSFDISSQTTVPVKKVIYNVLNFDNKDANGNMKPVCIPANAGEYEGTCPKGFKELMFVTYHDPATTNPIDSFSYSDVYVTDANWENKVVNKVVFKIFFAEKDNSLSSMENSACNLTVEKYVEPVIDPTCRVPDTQTNPNSTGCSNVLAPLIQKTDNESDDKFTIMNKMRGIDPTTQIKFNWADTVPTNNANCPVIYMLNVYETNDDGTIEGMNVLKQDSTESKYLLDPNILDFGKNYYWNASAFVVQKNACSQQTLVSENYFFTTNDFPKYIKSGVSFNEIQTSGISSILTNTPASGISSCVGNVGCTDLISNKGDTWGGDLCFTGNKKFIDTQTVSANMVPQNPVYYWFDYFDEENFFNNSCSLNEMLKHRIAFVENNKISTGEIRTEDLSIMKTEAEISNLADLYYEFDVSQVVPVKTIQFSNDIADIEATRFFDDFKVMRIVYKIEFKDPVGYKKYKILASMVGTALDPRGTEVQSSVVMYDIPVDWDLTGPVSTSTALEPVRCSRPGGGGGDDDDDCTCPGACCDKYPDCTGGACDPDPDPDPGPAPAPDPKPKPPPPPPRPPRPIGGGCSSDSMVPVICP